MEKSEFVSLYAKKLNEQQLHAVESVDGPVLLLAVPGSGKTTVLVTRIGYMILFRNISPDNILVLTYTIAATKDMGQRFSSIFGEDVASKIEFRTINGICSKIIQAYGKKIGKTSFDLITEEKETNRIISDIISKILPEYPTESDIKNLKTWITYCKNMLLDENEIRKIGSRENIPLTEAYSAYNQFLKDNRLMDYDDQMVYAYRMLQTDNDLLSDFRKQFQYICVDEAQDTSKIQHEIICLLSGVNGNLFMVGDEDQSIYGFRAAYPEALLDFEKVHSNAKVLVMNRNYRSNAKIVSLSDCFIQRNEYRHKKTMQATHPEGSDVRFIELKGRSNQYNYLLKVAEDCKQETAVLYRLNESCIPLVDILERNNISYRIKGLEMTFFSHRVVQDVFNILRFARNPYDTDLFMKVYYKFQTYLKKNQAEKMCYLSKEKNIPILETAEYISSINGMVKGKCHSARTHLSNMLKESPDKAIFRIVNRMGYGDYMARNGMDTNKIFILTMLAYREKTLEGFEKRFGYLYNLLKEGPRNYNSKFILSTIHSSKGLEYDEVYLMDICDGVFPSDSALIKKPLSKSEEKAGEEERRLFYVGMTRAKAKLNIFKFEDEKSIFIDELQNPEVNFTKKINRKSSNSLTGTKVELQDKRKVTKQPGNGTTNSSNTDSYLNQQKNKAPVREPKCGDIVYQFSYGKGEIIGVGYSKSGVVKDFTVFFESETEKDFLFPLAFSKGMYYWEDVEKFKSDKKDTDFDKGQKLSVREVFLSHKKAEEEITNNKTEVNKNTAKSEEKKAEIKADSKELFERLKALRLNISKEESLPAFCVFSDKVLVDLAYKQPTTKYDMLDISGIAEIKYNKYGERFLEVIREFKNN
ncbi:MAG: UvrD-helicase domain-containing protein [Lachnospiraceae bacterium]|nr:UvrD-helicase domain-containing protein [Lachnospiraceae bacterium]